MFEGVLNVVAVSFMTFCDTDAASKRLLALPMEAQQRMALIDRAVSENKDV